ncbi:MAG: hypothetical protein ACUVSK_11660 [Desulfotomaculales bacterium]
MCREFLNGVCQVYSSGCYPEGCLQPNRPVAVLSTTVLPKDGVYRVETLPPGQVPDIKGVPHYIGHPATKEIVESLGAVPAPTKLFEGLEPGESAVCFLIAQGKSMRAVEGFTSPHQDVAFEDLQVRIIIRLG